MKKDDPSEHKEKSIEDLLRALEQYVADSDGITVGLPIELVTAIYAALSIPKLPTL